MRKDFIIYLSCFFCIISNANANSYLDMITQPPEEQPARAPVPLSSSAPKNPEYYLYPKETAVTPQKVTSVPTVAPVVSPAQEKEKYYAWMKAAQTPEESPLISKDDLQNFIYTLETGLLGAGLYEIYRRK